MERHYKAFISYRHLPLDVWAAKKLHRCIERYVIPKELRKDGEKKLGLVFRDEDELPLSSNLSASIETALDNTEFLIVICTPETPKSNWVLREIDYFLSHHDRDHVLAVLLEGTPATSFPPALTQVVGKDGEAVDRIEPIAANLAAPTPAKREKLFQVEKLRILAALIGCHFDALYRREQRWKRRRAALVSAAVGVVAASFIGMLINRNAQINEQLVQTQINESLALASLSAQAYGEGDYFASLRQALQALPDAENGRPYVAQAERALAEELPLYSQGVLHYACSFEKDTDFSDLKLSADGSVLAVSDLYDTVAVFDAATGAERWHAMTGRAEMVFLPEAAEGVLAVGGKCCALYALDSGALRWERTDLSGVNLMCLSPSGALGLYLRAELSAADSKESVMLVDLKSGETLRSFPLGPESGNYCGAAAFDDTETRAAFLLQDLEDETACLYLMELSDGSCRELARELPSKLGSDTYRLLFTDDGDVVLGFDSLEGSACLRLYDSDTDYALRCTTNVETSRVTKLFLGPSASIDLLACNRDRIVFGSKNELFMLDDESGEVLWDCSLPGTIAAAEMYADGSLGLILSDGTLSACSVDGTLSYTAGVDSFSTAYPLAGAVLRGESYRESVFVLVPESRQRSAVAVRFLEDPDMRRLVSFPENVTRTILLPSDSGALVACIGYDVSNSAVCCAVLNMAEASAGETFPLPMQELWRDPGSVRLSDAGVLTTKGYTLDTWSMEMRPPEKQDAIPTVSSLYELSVRGETLSAELYERTLTVQKADTKELLCILEAPPAAARLLFARGDELLIVCSRTGLLNIYDAQSGTLLHSSDHGDLVHLFQSSGACYSVSEIPEEHRLFLFCDSLVRSEAVCIAVDTERWDCVGVYKCAAGYLARTDSMLVCPRDGIYLCPRRTLDDMTAQARAILAAAEGA